MDCTIRVMEAKMTGARSIVPAVPVASARATRPFLKWTGGKQWLAELVEQLIPHDFDGTYFEPFLGGGALFFALAPRRASLSDLNQELIATYIAVKQDVELLIRTLRSYPHSKQFFEMIRTRKPRTRNTTAARLVYLNKTAFNGIYRVNREGSFNVPFGRYENPTICQKDRLREAARALKSAKLKCLDFEAAVSAARPGDFVYFDPPYITGHTNNGFRKYNSKLFAWPDQERLATAAKHLADRGVHVLVSNADHEAVVSLYDGFQYTSRTRRSLISSDGFSRQVVTEALISSYPIEPQSVTV